MRELMWLAEVPWKSLPQRHHHLVAALQQEWSVLFVEPPPAMTLPRLSIQRRDGIRVAQLAPIINARQPAAQRLLAQPALRRLGSALAVWQLRYITRRAGIRRTTDLLIVCSSIYLSLAAVRLEPHLFILDLCDDHRYFSGSPPWAEQLHWAAAQRADVVTTSSLALKADLEALFPGKVQYLSNGVPATFLQSLPATRRTNQGNRVVEPPHVGYVGMLSDWFDFALMERVARALPEVKFVLAGPVDPAVAEWVKRLNQLANVNFPGYIPSQAVPDLLAQFAVGIIPFRKTPLTRAVNPNKLYEYAAFDLPIVCTNFSPDLRRFDTAIDVCSSETEFISILRSRAAGEGCRSTRWIAETHTWEEIGQQIVTILNSHPEEKRRYRAAKSPTRPQITRAERSD